MTDAWTMHFDSQAVDFRMRSSKGKQRIARSESDFQNTRGLTRKDLIEIELHAIEHDAIEWPQFSPRAFLSSSHPSRAHNEAANASLTFDVRRSFVGCA